MTIISTKRCATDGGKDSPKGENGGSFKEGIRRKQGDWSKPEEIQADKKYFAEIVKSRTKQVRKSFKISSREAVAESHSGK